MTDLETLIEFTITEEDEGEPDLPSYSDPGWILFEIAHIYRCGDAPTRHTRYEIEVIDYDPASSVAWLGEGMGLDYFIQEQVELEETGFYVLEGIVGHYYRGDGWTTDDDEEWEFALCRRATEEEIQAGTLP